MPLNDAYLLLRWHAGGMCGDEEYIASAECTQDCCTSEVEEVDDV